jgi:membrane protein implicated in regulation of membrane protease activity
MGSKKFVQKPNYCKISIVQTAGSFELYVPPLGFQPAILFILVFAIFWNGFILIWTLAASQAPFPGNIPFMLFSLPFWGVGLFLAYTCLFCFYGKTYIHMDRQVVNYAQKIFGRRVSKQESILTYEIRKLTLIRKHWYKDSDGARQEKPAELRIEGGGQKISLGGTGGGIDDEATIDWLAYEISEWLDLPLEVIE